MEHISDPQARLFSVFSLLIAAEISFVAAIAVAYLVETDTSAVEEEFTYYCDDHRALDCVSKVREPNYLYELSPTVIAIVVTQFYIPGPSPGLLYTYN